MADFCTVADVAAFLQVEISDAAKVASCERAIAEASEAIRNYCRQQIDLVAPRCSTWPRPGRQNCSARAPVASVAAVVEDGETLSRRGLQLGSYGSSIAGTALGAG